MTTSPASTGRPPFVVADLAWVALGGALGAVLRAVISTAAAESWLATGSLTLAAAATLPWATLAINALGSLALALLPLWPAARERRRLQLLLGPGLLGGFTTFSTYAAQSDLLLAQSPTRWLGLGYLVLTVSCCLVGAGFGRWLLARRTGAP